MMNAKDQLLRDAYVEYLSSKAFDPYFDKLYPPPFWRYLLAIPLILSLAGIGIGLGLAADARRDARKRTWIRQQLIEAAKRSVPITTIPLLINVTLRRKKGAVAPVRVIGTFDPDMTVEEIQTLGLTLTFINKLDKPDSVARKALDNVGAAIRMMFEAQKHVDGRRIAVPKELTKGRQVYAFDLMVLGAYHPAGSVEIPVMHCVAEPGDFGTIQMIPWTLIASANKGAFAKDDAISLEREWEKVVSQCFPPSTPEDD